MALQSRFADKLLRLAEGYNAFSCHWEVTSRCNAACGYCFVRDNTAGDMPAADMLRIADKLAQSGIMSMSVSGGEPFARPDILQILERIIANDFFSLLLFTNGILLTPAHLRFLSANARYISAVHMSAFSHLPAVNDAYFGVNGALEKILKAGQKMLEAGLKIDLAVNVMPFNVEQIARTRAFFIDRGFHCTVSLQKFLAPSNRAAVGVEAVRGDFFRRALACVDGEVLDEMLRPMRSCLRGGATRQGLCLGRKYSICVDARGDIHPCALLRRTNMGPILQDAPLKEILKRSDEYRRIRTVEVNDLEECSACRYFAYCPICLGARQLEHGDVLRPRDQVCELARAIHDVCEKQDVHVYEHA